MTGVDYQLCVMSWRETRNHRRPTIECARSRRSADSLANLEGASGTRSTGSCATFRPCVVTRGNLVLRMSNTIITESLCVCLAKGVQRREGEGMGPVNHHRWCPWVCGVIAHPFQSGRRQRKRGLEDRFNPVLNPLVKDERTSSVGRLKCGER